MASDFVQAYDLERDREYVERVQRACVERSEFALKSDRGLFGTKPWWEAIREGTIPTHRVEGTIVTISKQGGWPEFEIDTRGDRSTWALDGKVEAYTVGKQAQVAYVRQEFLKPAADAERETPIVIGIWVEP